MKYFYISLFLSITFLVIGTAASIEQKHSATKAQAELSKAQELQDDDAPEVELTFGEKCVITRPKAVVKRVDKKNELGLREWTASIRKCKFEETLRLLSPKEETCLERNEYRCQKWMPDNACIYAVSLQRAF